MKSRKILVIALATAMLFSLAGGLGQAQGPGGEPLPPNTDQQMLDEAVRPAAGPATTLPYTARLSGLAGEPVPDGHYDVRFALYDAAEGGQPLWSEAQTGIMVKSGDLVATLGLVNSLAPDLSTRGPLWLAAEVRGPGQIVFDALSPRQPLTPAASATSLVPAAPQALSCAHTHFGESWTGSRVGYAFRVSNTNAGLADGIRGYSGSTNADYAGLYGYNSSTGSAVFGESQAGLGVRGASTSNAGVLGESTSGDGVAGKSRGSLKSGVYGVNTAAAGTVGYGVFGRASNGNGMGADGNDASGYDQLADVVLGGTRGEILARSTFINVISNQHINMILDNDNNSDNNATEFRVYNGTDGKVWSVDELGNTWALGFKGALVKTATAGQRTLYAVESTGVWFEDFGTATLVNGEVVVKIEDVFLQTISPDAGYHVFLTPLGDGNGLYVAAKDVRSFTVREQGGGTSNISFDWRLTAKRRGYEAARMEQPVDTGEVTR